MKPIIININDFKGGMTLNEKMGREDQFHVGNGLDFFTKPGKISCGYSYLNMKLLAVSFPETIPCQFPWMVFTPYSASKEMWFGGDDTKIYYQDDTGNIGLGNDDTNTGGVKGMAYYKSYLYWASNTLVGRKDLSNVSATAGWDNDYSNWTLTTSTHHPMIVAPDGLLYIGHERYMASWDDTTFTTQALSLGDYWHITCLANFGYKYLAIGANFKQSGYPTKGKVFLWDRIHSTLVTDVIEIPESEIQAMTFDSGYLWIWAGKSANIYVCGEESRQATKMWSFTTEDPGDYIHVYPGAVTTRGGTIFFGLSDVDTTSDEINPCGIYSFPSEPQKFSLNISYKNVGYGETFKGVYNSIWSAGENVIFHSYHDGTDKHLTRELRYDADTSPYKDTATCESLRYYAPANKKISTEALGLSFDALPAGCLINAYYKKDESTGWTQWITDFDTATAIEKVVYKRIEAKSIKFKITLRGLTSAGFDRPFVGSLWVTGDLINKV